MQHVERTLIALTAAAALAACPSSEDDCTGANCAASASTGTSSGSGGSGDTGGGGGLAVPSESCVKEGETGNANGVGHFCTPGGGECAAFPKAGLCLADLGQTQWMCARIGCDETTDCGEGAGCLITDQGSACLPCKCESSAIGCGGVVGGGGSGGA